MRMLSTPTKIMSDKVESHWVFNSAFDAIGLIFTGSYRCVSGEDSNTDSFASEK